MNVLKSLLFVFILCFLTLQTQAGILDWLAKQYAYWFEGEDKTELLTTKRSVLQQHSSINSPDGKDLLMAASLLVDVVLDNTTPSANDEFCYRVRYRCASVTEHCFGAYIDMTLPMGVEIARLPREGGNIISVSTSGTSATGIYLRVDLQTNNLAYLEAGSAGAFKVCGSWPCEDDGIGQSPAAATSVNFVNSIEFHENSSTQIATDPAALTVPTFTICPPPAVTTSEFTKEDDELNSESAQPNGVFRYAVRPKITTNQVEYIDSIPDALEIYDFRVDRSSWAGWTIACDCGSGFIDVFYSTGVGGLSAKLNWVGAQDSDPTFPDLMGADGITDTGCDAVYDTDLGYYIISGLQKIRWITDAAGFSGSSSDYATVTAKIKDDIPAGTTIQNCAVATDLSASTSLGTSCFDITIRNEPLVKIRKYRQTDLGTTDVISGIPAGYYKQEDDIQWELRVTYDNSNGKEHQGFSVIDTLPKGLTFIDDSGDPPNWYLPSYNYPAGLPTNLIPLNQEGCNNPIFTKTTLVDGRMVLKWDFPTCILTGGRDDTEVAMKVFFTTRYDRCITFPTNVTNCAYADFGEPVYETDTGLYYADGQVKHTTNFDLGSSNTFDAAGLVTSEKWVQGALDTDFSRYPSFGATNLDGEGVYELFIWNLTDELLTTIDVVDILPHLGDNALVGTDTRDSEWSATLASAITVEILDIPSNTWTTVPATDLPLDILYGTSYNACYLDGADPNVDFVRADPSTANFPASCTDMSSANPAVGANAFAFRWENTTTPMQFGQGLKITVNVQQLDGEADAPTGAIAWNSFAYTATQQTSGELLSTEPIKVGLRMVDECTSVTTGDRIWNDTNGNGIQDPGEEGIAGVTVHLYQSNGDTVFVAPSIPFETQTDANGMYYLPGLPDGDYIIRLDNFIDTITAAPLDDLILTIQNATADTLDSDAVLGNNAGTDATLYPEILVSHIAQCEAETANDFGFIKPATLTTFVWEDLDADGEQTIGEPAIQNITVELLDAANTVVQTATTNDIGEVAFSDIFPGTYKLRYSAIPLAYVFTSQDLSGNEDTDSDANSLGETANFIVTACDLITYIDAGITLPPANPATITGIVWDELGAKNGVQDINEPLLEDITVQLLDASGFLLGATTTDATGTYQFTDLTPNTGYQIQVLPPDTAIVFTIAGADMDADAAGLTAVLTPTADETIADIDIGLCGLFSIGNLVWFDVNNDGLWNNNEGIFPNVNVYLIDGADGTTYLDTTITDANGKYLFTELAAATYIVEVEIPTGEYTSSDDIGSTFTPNTLDSDDNGNGTASTGRIRSSRITLQNTAGSPTDANWTESDHGEPINGILDKTSNPKAYYTVDFGFRPPICEISITNVSTTVPNGAGMVSDTIFLSIESPPTGEQVSVHLNGNTINFTPSAAVDTFVVFTNQLASGSVDSTWAYFNTSTTCGDTTFFIQPKVCPNTTTILYLCAYDKPQDADAFDHGMLQYLQGIEGITNIEPYVVNNTGLNHADTWAPLTTNYDDFDLIYVSPTLVNNNWEASFPDSLRATTTPIINHQWTMAPLLGIGISNYQAYQTNAQTTTGNTEIYNYNVLNPIFAQSIFSTDYNTATAEVLLWQDAAFQALEQRGVLVHYEAGEQLADGSTANGIRLHLGYSQDGINEGASNTGTFPVPEEEWFNPFTFLTPEGKKYLDEALVRVQLPCRNCELFISSTSITNCSGASSYTADLQVEVRYKDAPSGEAIHVTLDGGNTQTIVAGAASPQTVTFSGIPADGTAGHEIIATFATTSSCADTANIKYPVPCPPNLGSNAGEICASVAADEIGGTVFEDWNYDGLMNQSDTIGVAGVEVTIYDENGIAVATTYTDTDGNYRFTGLTGSAYRVEFVLPDAVACWATPTNAGGNNGTTVQFVQARDCANLGVASPSDYCQENPYWVTSCYLYGDQSGTGDVLVSGAYNLWESTQAVGAANQHEGLANQMGTVLGLAYHRSSRTLFAAAFQKRHSGYAAGSTGTIYQVPEPYDNLTGNGDGGIAPSVFVDLNTLFGTNVVGDNPHPTATTIFLEDYDAYDSAGKVAFGDIDLSEDGSTLWAVNLHDRSLYKIPLGNDPLNPTPPTSSSEIDIYPLYNLYDGNNDGQLDNANNVDIRPFGLKVHRDKVYIGMVNSAESSITPSDPDGDENLLRGLVFAFDPISITFELVLDFPLNYARGCGTRSVPGCIGQGEWRPWSPIFQKGYLNWDYNNITGYPQPIISDIEFTEDGTMILALRDRFGDQMGGGAGTLAPPPPSGVDSSYYKGNAIGDILRAVKVGDAQWNVSFVEATDGTEYFAGDSYVGTTGNIIHAETVMGGLSILKGKQQAVYTVLDPEGSQSAGLDWVQYQTPSTSPDGYYTIYREFISTTFFGKANGLGELEMTCDPAPNEIGNYVWEDTNENGVQDAGEPGIQGVTVELYYNDGTLAATTITNANGEYYFSHADSTTQTWVNAIDSVQANTTYYVVVGNGQFAGGELSIGGIDYMPTQDSVNTGIHSEIRDSDGEIVASSPMSAFNNLVATQVTTGSAGFVDHSIDFGFIPLCTPPLIASPIPTAASTVNGTDGTINMTIYNGATSYSYNWDDGMATGSGTGTSITGLSPGTYNITVTDGDGCTSTTFSTVEEVICVPKKTVIEKTKMR